MKKKIVLCIIINFILTAYVLITHYTKVGIGCPIRALTGIYCFMCGATRSTWAILDRDFVSAYYYNAFYFIFFKLRVYKSTVARCFGYNGNPFDCKCFNFCCKSYTC